MALQHSAPVGLPETLQGDVAHANASPESPTGLGQLHAVVDILKRPSQVKELVPHGLEIRCMLSATRQMHDQMLDYDISGAWETSKVLAKLTWQIKDVDALGRSSAKLARLTRQPEIAEFTALVLRRDFVGAVRVAVEMDMQSVLKKMSVWTPKRVSNGCIRRTVVTGRRLFLDSPGDAGEAPLQAQGA
eukprot:CAMPEP_0176294632 /NCGR_PEP_ID=MMETSP0121_2-20121125/57239_1 /TAXON_ID=160619 /ORGANISM="Kryptoperidinium foliaceum, Strain CCMP 1326" /LENGTH=188 /DNA_ID=CAMNT_0017635661 /DNA_START=64 /DNA_END=626 /DNA_ORIENTATION=-